MNAGCYLNVWNVGQRVKRLCSTMQCRTPGHPRCYPPTNTTALINCTFINLNTNQSFQVLVIIN